MVPVFASTLLCREAMSMSLLPMLLVLFATLKLSPVIAASLVAIAPSLLAMLA